MLKIEKLNSELNEIFEKTGFSEEQTRKMTVEQAFDQYLRWYGIAEYRDARTLIKMLDNIRQAEEKEEKKTSSTKFEVTDGVCKSKIRFDLPPENLKEIIYYRAEDLFGYNLSQTGFSLFVYDKDKEDFFVIKHKVNKKTKEKTYTLLEIERGDFFYRNSTAKDPEAKRKIFFNAKRKLEENFEISEEVLPDESLWNTENFWPVLVNQNNDIMQPGVIFYFPQTGEIYRLKDVYKQLSMAEFEVYDLLGKAFHYESLKNLSWAKNRFAIKIKPFLFDEMIGKIQEEYEKLSILLNDPSLHFIWGSCQESWFTVHISAILLEHQKRR